MRGYSLKRLAQSLVFLAVCSGRVLADGAACGDALTQRIPARAAVAPSGSELASRVSTLSDDAREAVLRQELLRGNVPSALRHLVPVSIFPPTTARVSRITVCVLPDYLAVGSDASYLLVPLRVGTALAVARHFGFVLPTTALVDAIYRQSRTHLEPQPLPASSAMRSTPYYRHHNELVLEQRQRLESPFGWLTAGHKKDLVITNRLWSHPTRVAIYGWHRLDGQAIQPLSTVHGLRYADYSHGARLVSETAYVDGKPRSLIDLLQDPALAPSLNGEGPIKQLPLLLARLTSL